MTEEPLTVAQATARLGISERTLRRVLRDPEHQAKLQAVTRQVNGRLRDTIMIPPELYRCLKERFLSANQPANQQAAGGILPVDMIRLYERLIEEQNARITELQQALEYEREQSRLHAAAALKAQALLAEATSDKPRKPFWKR